jgi:DNA-directed RNA polymerase specialized sigma24 family protein
MRADWSGHQVVDPMELQTRFSGIEGISNMSSYLEEPTENSTYLLAKVKSIMESLPPREADFVDLYYFKKLRQTDIANIFKVSQPTVCYRLQRATARIQYLLQIPDIKQQEIEDNLQKILEDELDIKIMILMYQTTCQSEVAKRLGVSQGLVRHRFIRSLERMRKNTELIKYVKIFDIVAENLNILREVRRASLDEDEVIFIVD